MGYVFISYSSKDKDFAIEFYNILERNKINAWMAPNDIPVGSSYAAVIIDAIKQSVGTVLLLSNSSQNSQHVEREIENSIKNNKPIFPLQLEQVVLNPSFEYYIGSKQIIPVSKIDENDKAIKQIIDILNVLAEKAKIPEEYVVENGLKLSADKKRLIRLLDVTLDTVIVPEGVEVIEEYGFNHSEVVSKIVLPSSIKEIKCQAFADCNALTSINLPESLDRIGNLAFSKCKSLKHIVLPFSLECVPYALFENCSRLEEVVFGNNIKEIKDCAFSKCSSLKSLSIPDSIVNIGSQAFCDCRALHEITLPKKIHQLNMHIFNGCSSLSEIRIPKEVVEIRHHSFANCKSLTTVYLPKSLVEIQWAAFENCDNLKTIVFEGNSKEFSLIEIGEGNECFKSAEIVLLNEI